MRIRVQLPQKWYVLLLFGILWGACKGGQPVAEKDKYPTVDESALRGKVRTNLDSPKPTASQLSRKQRSIVVIKSLGLPYIDGLPVVEDETAISPRTQQEIAERALALAICAVKGESNDQALVDQLIDRYKATSLFSPAEAAFIHDREPSQQQLADFAWQYECLHVLLWSLGHLHDLKPPNEICDVPKEVGIIRDLGRENLISKANLRPMPEILDAADLYYRFHWAAIELRLKGKTSDKINEEIVSERHKALNWLIRYMSQDWDDVTTDT